MNTTLPLRHILLSLVVVTVWGSNFVVIRMALDHLPPFLFAGLRFLLVAFPRSFSCRVPKVPIGNLAAYGLLIGSGQFAFLFVAMRGHISPGLASLVLQMQVFFTIGLSVWLGGERLRLYQGAALALAVSGILVIVVHTDGATTPFGLGLVLMAALSWAGGNIAGKRSGVRSMLPYIVWASVFSAPPLFILSFALEGWSAIESGLRHAGVATWAAVLWQTVGNTMFGYAAWGWLLARHPAASITPMALLVPVVGMAASALWLGESLPAWKLLAAGLVISGLAFGILYPRWRPITVA